MPIYGRVNGDTQRITIRVNISNGAVDVTRMVHWDDIKREAEEE